MSQKTCMGELKINQALQVSSHHRPDKINEE